MKLMLKYLLLLVLSLGMLSFTQTLSNSPDTILFPSAQFAEADTLSPVHNIYLKYVANPALKRSYPKNTSSNVAVEKSSTESSTLVVTRAIAVCKGNGHFIGGKPRFISGNYRDTLTSSIGRDSIVITELSILDCQSI